MYDSLVNEKLQGAAAYYGTQQAQTGVAGTMLRQDACENMSYQPSHAEQAKKKADYHRAEANKAEQASAFFATNPAFEEFIKLIRAGAIQI